MSKITRRTLLAGASIGLMSSRVWAQAPSEVKVGLLVPISGLYARPGAVMRDGAEMAVDHINAQGGIKSLGGAKLKLVVLDSGDTTEKAKNAAQRMVAQEPDLVAASGAYLSSFTLAVTEVTERANLPVLTLSYSDLITDRGFKYVFQTSATAGSQAKQALPQIVKLAEAASGKKPKTVRDHHRQHRRIGRLGKVDARGFARRKRAATDRRRNLHPTARRRNVAGAKSPLGQTGPACSSCRP